MRRIVVVGLVLLCAGLPLMRAVGQGYPMGGGGPGQISGNGGRGSHEADIPNTPSPEKPDKVAAKSYAAGMKSLAKARELEDFIAKATDPDKKANAMEKLGDTYGRALDQFTEVLRNKSDMYDAWNQVGYVHLRLGAYRESLDDYNHALALKPDLPEAILHQAEAYLGVDHLEETKTAYMDLFYHERPLADELMVSMQTWLQSHRSDARGVRASDIESFDKWLQERESLAKTTASTGS